MATYCKATQNPDSSVTYSLGENMGKVKDGVDMAVKLLSFLAPMTAIKVDDEFLEVALALQASPEMLAYLERKLDSFGNLPEGVMAVDQVPEDAQNQILLELKWDGSRLGAVLKNLPEIIKLIVELRKLFPAT